MTVMSPITQGTTSRFFPRVCTCRKQKLVLYAKVLESAVRAMKLLGPGMSEKAYEQHMFYSLYCNNIATATQFHVYSPQEHTCKPPILCGILDMLVQSKILVELKANQRRINSNHIEQVMRYYDVMQKKPMEGKLSSIEQDDDTLLAIVINFTQINSQNVVQIWNNATKKHETLYVDKIVLRD